LYLVERSITDTLWTHIWRTHLYQTRRASDSKWVSRGFCPIKGFRCFLEQ